jgi:hypothetical protein
MFAFFDLSKEVGHQKKDLPGPREKHAGNVGPGYGHCTNMGVRVEGDIRSPEVVPAGLFNIPTYNRKNAAIDATF